MGHVVELGSPNVQMSAAPVDLAAGDPQQQDVQSDLGGVALAVSSAEGAQPFCGVRIEGAGIDPRRRGASTAAVSSRPMDYILESRQSEALGRRGGYRAGGLG